MSYITQCQLCSEHVNRTCPNEKEFKDITCPNFKDYNRFGHMSPIMKLIFWLYIGIVALSQIGSFIYMSLTPDSPTLVIICNMLWMVYMIYAVVAFMKPLPDGAFITQLMMIYSLFVGIVIIILGLVFKNMFLCTIGGIWSIITVLLYVFIRKDNEFDYLFPKNNRKVFFWDWILVGVLGIGSIVLLLMLIGLMMLSV